MERLNTTALNKHRRGLRCTITHEGRAFTSGGAWRNGDHAMVYITAESRLGGVLPQVGTWKVTDWHGASLGRVTHAHTYRVPTRYGGYRMACVDVTLEDGTRWYGRFNIDGRELCRLRRVKGGTK